MGCGCLFALVAFLSPRLAFILIWIFTSWVEDAFSGFLIPLLGVIFLPWTAFLWVVAYAIAGEVNALSIFALAIGIIADLSTHAGSAYSGRNWQNA